MKKKTVAVKELEALKATNKKLKEESEAYQAVIGFSVLALIVGGIVYGCFWLCSTTPKYEEGQCLINRMYQPVQITAVYKHLEQYTISYQKVQEDNWVGAWKLVKNYDQMSDQKSIDFVDKTYTAVECQSVRW